MKTIPVSETVNGFDLGVLGETVEAIRKEPERARCRFRVRNRWHDAAHNASRVWDFYANRQEMRHLDAFTLDSEEPVILGGEDTHPNPVEYLLHALASCVTTSMIAHAAVRGIEVEELACELEGDIDLRGFLGLEPSIPKGFTEIRVLFKVKAPEDKLPELRELCQFSPVLNTLVQGTRVEIQMERADLPPEGVG